MEVRRDDDRARVARSRWRDARPRVVALAPRLAAATIAHAFALGIVAVAGLATSLVPWPSAEALAADAPPRVLRVATSGDYAPFSRADANGDLSGFDVDLARLYAKDRGLEVEFVRFRWPELGGMLAAGSFDVALSGVTVRPERSIAGRYGVSVAASQAVALTWRGSGATSLRDLDRGGRRVAVNAGGHLEKVAHRTIRHATVVPIADNEAVRMALLDRAFDAVVTDTFEEKVWTDGVRDVVRIGPLSEDRKAPLLPADRDELAADLDRWLMTREKDGTLGRLRATHFGTPADGGASTPAATAGPASALADAVAERLALMPMVWDAKKAVGAPVQDPVQEAAVLDAARRAVADAAAQAGVPAPEPAVVTPVFDAIVAMGRDVQQALAAVDARRRPGVVIHRPDAGQPTDANDDANDDAKDDATGAATGDAKETSAAAATNADATKTAPPAAGVTVVDVARRDPEYDLATQLRPAIARISGRIARILVAIDGPLDPTALRRTLGSALAPHDVTAARVDELSDAVSRYSQSRGAR